MSKIAEIDKRVAMLEDLINYKPNCTGQANCMAMYKSYASKYEAQLRAYKTNYATGGILFWNPRFPTVSKIYSLYEAIDSYARGNAWLALNIEYQSLLQEQINQERFLTDQTLLQQQAATATANALATQAEIRIKEAEALVLQAQFKSEQEKQIASQQLQKAEQELQKAKVAGTLAAAGGKGNLESAKILMGGSIAKNYKTPLIITGIVLGATAIGFVMYKFIK